MSRVCGERHTQRRMMVLVRVKSSGVWTMIVGVGRYIVTSILGVTRVCAGNDFFFSSTLSVQNLEAGSTLVLKFPPSDTEQYKRIA